MYILGKWSGYVSLNPGASLKISMRPIRLQNGVNWGPGHALWWKDGFESVGEASIARDSCGWGEIGSVIWHPEIGIQSKIRVVYCNLFCWEMCSRAWGGRHSSL